MVAFASTGGAVAVFVSNGVAFGAGASAALVEELDPDEHPTTNSAITEMGKASAFISER